MTLRAKARCGRRVKADRDVTIYRIYQPELYNITANGSIVKLYVTSYARTYLFRNIVGRSIIIYNVRENKFTRVPCRALFCRDGGDSCVEVSEVLLVRVKFNKIYQLIN